MTSYIIRRLLLMVPTILGITFLVFMLIALSPGGIGAALQAGSGALEASSRANQEAYLEDRYGLDDSIVVQYFRWLSRISPIKFGVRDQVHPTGEIIRSPRELKPPPLAGVWYARDAVPTTSTSIQPATLGDTQDDKNRAYRAAAQEYARVRAQFVLARNELKQAIADYADVVGLKGAVKPDGQLVISKLERHTPDTSTPQRASAMKNVETAGAAAIEAYREALKAREALVAVFRAKPFDQAGIAIIPGVISLAAPDFGVSFSKSTPVAGMIADRLPVTLLINLLAFPIIYMIAIPFGMLAATKQGTWVDVASGALFVALWSVPVVWAGVLMIGFLASDQYLGLFPAAGLHSPDADTYRFLPRWTDHGLERGFALDTLWHICLPVACLTYGGFAILSKQTRAAMLENFNADYVRTAKAKGVAQKDVVFRHVFRNSLLPLITMFATVFPAMLSGSVVIERIFSVPGMGSLIIESINLRDREILLANVFMIGVVNLLALLIADILYALADPRISYK